MADEGTIQGTPGEAPVLAEEAVAWARDRARVALSYTAESLPALDELIEGIRKSGASEEEAGGLLYALGCFLGEVFVRTTGATWGTTVELEMTKACSYPIALKLPGGERCNPIGKVFKRYRNGSGDSVAFFYSATRRLTQQPPLGPDTKSG
jgi:hypothetical protein